MSTNLDARERRLTAQARNTIAHVWASKRTWIVVAVAVLSTVAATGACAISTYTLDSSPRPRDEASFVRELGTYGLVGDRKIHPYSLIAEGDRACAWLANQPVPDGRDVGSSTEASARRYLRHVAPPVPRSYGVDIRREVVYTAWYYLCDPVEQEHLWIGPGAEFD